MARHFCTFSALAFAAVALACSWRGVDSLMLQKDGDLAQGVPPAPAYFQFDRNTLLRIPLNRAAHREIPAEHCRLRHALDAMDNDNMEPVIFGTAAASATQGAGAGVGVENTWFAGLGRELRQDRVVMQNAAQGSTDTFWSAMTMDAVVHDADVLFWEFAINDRMGASTGHPVNSQETMAMAMEIWIRKAMMLPKKPALVILYLWDAGDTELWSTAQRAHEKMLKKYIDEGLDILTLWVGYMFKGLEASHGWTTLADAHHPSKESHEFITHLIFKTLRAVQAETDPACDVNRHNTAVERVELSPDIIKHPFLARIAVAESVSEAAVLPRFRPDPAEPAFDLLTCPESGECLEADVKWKEGTKASALRTDRKLAWALPTCASGNESDGNFHQRVVVQFSNQDICDKATIVALKVGGGSWSDNMWIPEEPLVVGIRGQLLGEINVPFTNIDVGGDEWSTEVPYMFGHAFNMFLDVQKDFTKTGPGTCEVSLCKKNNEAIGVWNNAYWGHGTIDWITVIY